ncbi:GPN-loop GTPase 3 [Neodiprion pinetum]|uniref:GPN-loop GTPase 3 n=1 Tax=Neodiprion lecontei TaxID=441921 RepID=A0A6J0CAV1_NEOLC|nr:GPN-loop GTPase 3 [Neodiprion lecontei]XP_046418008.1 GPN-loop GTPase 3 [Neodiprion fabricii]XP_046474465.1 GPN-loop GTPase 3 [Neodiprion pinetum]XP_046612135.1 GPN-loop GTPase 3 [Neodiprion virginianus]
MRYAQLVMGPAGCGKSTYCSTMVQHATDEKKVIEVVNLDPAAEYFDYEPLVDIRELIHLDDAMEDQELKFGPNGGLVFCMEYLLENSKWLEEQLGDVDEDYIIFDCPGQIELYTHMTVIRQLVDMLQNINFRICGVFLLDSQFMVDGSKFLSGTMAALSVMINLELPHINILTKMDLLSKGARKQLDRYLEPDPHSLLADMEKGHWNQKYRNLTEALGRLIEDYSLVRFYPLNIKDEENIADIRLTIDNIIQYGEEADVKMKDFDEPEQDDGD